MEYQTVVVGGGCGGAGAGAGAGAGGDGEDDRNKRPFPKEGGRLNNVNHSPKLACPRCHSTNTKFCYFNNYSLSQPRHYCKSCKRFWTRGGTLRNNVPVGGKRRQSRRSCSRPQSVAVSATHRASRRRRQRPASLPPQPILVPRSTVVFRNNGNMRHFRRQNDVNSSSSLTPSIVLSNIMRNNELLHRFDAMSFYPATAGPVLGDSLNVGHDVPPLLPPQPGVDDDDNNNHHEINNDEHNILEWVNNMGTGGFYEA